MTFGFDRRGALACVSVAVLTALAAPVAAQAQPAAYSFDIPSQDLGTALRAYGKTARQQISFDGAAVRGRKSAALSGQYGADDGLRVLLSGSGLDFRRGSRGVLMVEAPGPQGVGAQAAPAQTTAVDEVVVTARKRSERLLDVPAPVSAVSEETLQRTKAVRLEDYLTLVPGATFENQRAGQTKITFRGVNNGASNATVVTYVDDTPFTSSTGHASSAFVTPNLDPSDIAQIEVLRGPQGTLYGANAIGGVLRYVTVKPDPDEFSGRAEVGVESVAHGGTGLTERAAINLPIVRDKLALRVSGYDRDDPGYVDDPFLGLKDVNEAKVRGGRAALEWRASEDFKLDLSALTQTMSTHGSDGVDYDPLTGKPEYGDLTHHRYLRDEWFRSRYNVFNGTAQWDLPWATLVSSTSYSTQTNGADGDATPAYGALLSGLLGRPNMGLDNPLDVHVHKFTQEARLTSKGEHRLDWQIGGFYTHETGVYDQGTNLFDIDTQDYINSFGDIFVATLDSKYTEYSVYGNLDYHFSPAFDVALGARYSRDDQDFHLMADGLLIGPTQDISQPSTENAFTWLVNPRYKFAPDQMAYARIASGYRPGGANALTAAAISIGISPVYGPDHLISYEVGWKGAFFNHRVTADISAFYVDWTDVQLMVNLAGFNFQGNGGKAHSEGIESYFTWRPTDGLNLAASMTYNANKLDGDSQSNSDLSQAGNRLPGTPEFAGSFSADYDWPLNATTTAFVGATVSFSTDRPGGLSLGYDPSRPSGQGAVSNFGTIPIYDSTTGAVIGQANTRLPGYTTLDVRVGVEHGDWTLSAYAKNLTDARAFSEYGGLNDPNFSNFSTIWAATVLRPRTLGVSLACKF